jgi:hypothetical protein
MCLVATSALALWMNREALRSFNSEYQINLENFGDACFTLYRLSIFPAQWALASSLGVLALNLKPSRTVRDLAERPGFLGCLAAILYMLIRNVFAIPYLMRTPRVVIDDYLSTADIEYAGYCVAAAWLPSLMGRKWAIHKDGVERLGRGVGVFWIVVCLFMQAVIALISPL